MTKCERGLVLHFCQKEIRKLELNDENVKRSLKQAMQWRKRRKQQQQQ